MSKAPAVDYAIQIIECISKRNCAMSIADISNELNINKNAVSRILGSFIENGWVYPCNNIQKQYALTLKPFSVVSKCVNNSSLVKISEPFLKELHNKLGDSVYLGIKKEKSVLYLLHYDSTKPVKINGCVGGEYPLHSAAAGKILLSWAGTEDINNYFGLNANSFVDEANKIKKLGYAIDNENFGKGIICYASPLFDNNGNVIASIGISSLTIYDSVESLTEKGLLVSECAEKISKALGYNKGE